MVIKVLIILLYLGLVYSYDLLNEIKNVQLNMIGYEKYGCQYVYNRTINQVDQFRVLLDRYLVNQCNNSQDIYYRFVSESLKPKLDSLSIEANFLLNRCNAQDFDSRALSLERPARIQQFLNEWNSTLRSLGEQVESDKFSLRPLYVSPSSIINQKPSHLFKDFYHFKDCHDSYCPEMIVIPTGSFIMGGTDKEHKDLGVSDEIRGWDQPQHLVTIKKRFAIGKYEVTLKQFREFIKETGHVVPKGCITIKTTTVNGATASRLLFTDFIDYENLGGDFDTSDENQPVSCVRREDARDFATWLSRKTNQTYRLPYETEWEYVARANQGYQYYIWGNSTEGGCKYANLYDIDSWSHFNFTFQHFNCHDGYKTSAPVGRFLPNQFGVYDMLGNVREIVDDAWSYSYNNTPRDGSRMNLENNAFDNFVVLRGGSFFYNTFNVRIAYRNAYFSSQSKSYMWGFRLVREIN